MEMLGTFVGGKVVLDHDSPLPDGTKVRVRVISEMASPMVTVGERLNQLAHEFKDETNDLPVDLSRNHDHYLYGVPKKST